MNEHFYMEIYLADTPHRRNAQHFGGGSEQLQELFSQQIMKAERECPQKSEGEQPDLFEVRLNFRKCS